MEGITYRSFRNASYIKEFTEKINGFVVKGKENSRFVLVAIWYQTDLWKQSFVSAYYRIPKSSFDLKAVIRDYVESWISGYDEGNMFDYLNKVKHLRSQIPE